MTCELSLVIPLHNEEENLTPLLDACRHALRHWPQSEIILVDDGSTDETPRRLRAACQQKTEEGPRLRGVCLRRRFGKGAALSAGIQQAEGALIATIDADLQENPEELLDLVKTLRDNDADLVTGWRRQRRDSWIKVASSRLFNAVVRWSTRLPIHDINCGFKVMRREFAEELTLTDGRFRFIPLLAQWWGFRWLEQGVEHRPRQRGRSSYGLDRFPGVLVDLFALACLIRYHSRPGHFFIQAGALSLFAGGGICAYLAGIWLRDGTIHFRYPLLALGVLLVAVGIQLVANGVLGEWLAYRHRSTEPGYRIRRVFERSEDDSTPEGES